MDEFVLLFLLSFVALIITLAIVYVVKSVNKGKGGVSVNKEIETFVEKSYFETTSDITTRWKLTLPKRSTRIKLRQSRKKRKGKQQ